MPVTISGSTGISGVDGSAGTPALIGSDADTGIFLAAGQVSASVNGTAGNVPLVSGTAQASTSGTSIDFTGIPSWAKRITVMFNGCSRSGTSDPLIQLGDAGGFETTGYLGAGSNVGTTSVATSGFTTGFGLNLGGTASIVYHGTVSVFLIGANTWACSGVLARSDATGTGLTGGSKTLSDTLTQIRITHVNGTDTFDAGSINIMYE